MNVRPTYLKEVNHLFSLVYLITSRSFFLHFLYRKGQLENMSCRGRNVKKKNKKFCAGQNK